MPFLTDNIVGNSSSLVYGLKGQEVTVIKQEGNMVLVHDDGGNRFYVRVEKLTYIQPEPDLKATLPEPPKSKKPTKQKSLF